MAKSRLLYPFCLFYILLFYNINPAAAVKVYKHTAHTSTGSFAFNGSFDATGGKAGAVFLSSAKKIVYVSGINQEIVGSPFARETFGDPHLAYDSQSNPHVFAPLSSTDIVHFQKIGGQWIRQTIFQLNQTKYPDLSNRITAVKAGTNNSFHILCTAQYAVSYITNKTGAWPTDPTLVESLSGFTNPYAFKTYVRGDADMAICPMNHAHVIYSTLFETRYLNNTTGSWVGEYVFKDQDLDYWPAEGPAIALDSVSNPAMVAMEQDHATTGSVLYSRLRYIVKSGSTWNATVIASAADTYVGSDGNKYTGDNANIVYDSQNRPHVLFSDIASSHNQNGYNYQKKGQARYGYFDGTGWNLATLFSQSQTNGEMDSLWLGVSSDGSQVYIYGQEVIRTGDPYAGYGGSNYNLLYFSPNAVTPPNPISPGLTANNSAGPVNLKTGDSLSVKVSLNPGSSIGTNADWWVLVSAPSNKWYYYNLNGQLMSGQTVTYQGGLFNLAPFEILNIPILPSGIQGIYTFYFGVDTIMNGNMDIGANQAFYSSVLVSISGQ